MELRVEGLAAQAGVSVDTIRYYQARSLLHPPRREGRVAWYDGTHLDRLRRVRSLQGRGFSLATIARILDGQLDAADEALVGALTEEAAPAGPGELLSLEDVASRTGIPAAALHALVTEGLLVPQRVGDRSGYTDEDVEAARAGLAILEWGIPLSELLDLATAHHRAMTDVARRAVDLFDTHVRHAARDDPDVGPDEAATRMVEAFHTLLPAAATLVSHHFTRILLQQALDHIEQVGSSLDAAIDRETSAEGRPTVGRPTKVSSPTGVADRRAADGGRTRRRVPTVAAEVGGARRARHQMDPDTRRAR